MALNITTLSERWGDLFGGVNEANTFAGTTIVTRADNIADEYTSIAGQREVIDDLTENATNVRSAVTDWTSALYTMVTETLRTMCRDDSARPKSESLIDLFDKLNRDMVADTKYFTRPTVTVTVAVPGTNIGDGYLIASAIEPIDGIATYYAYAEVIRVDCSSDSYSGGGTAGSESFAVNGETSVDLRAYNWPKGSGADTDITAISVNTDEIVTDGEMELWTVVSGVNYRPTEWDLLSGTVSGTHINRGATAYAGDFSCKFTGDGSTANTGIAQTLDQTVVKGSTNYAISFWHRSDAVISTGTLRIALVDGSGTVINDNAASAQSTTVAAGDFVNGTWTRKTLVLRTPRNLPTILKLEFKFTTFIDNTDSIFIDNIIMSEMARAYDGGPYLALHAGATAFALGDKFTCTVTNNKSTTNFVRCLDRTYELATNDIRLTTYGGSGTELNDGLIT